MVGVGVPALVPGRDTEHPASNSTLTANTAAVGFRNMGTMATPSEVDGTVAKK